MTEKTAKKGHVCKESGITTQGKREVEAGKLLLLVFKLQVWSMCRTLQDLIITINFLLANAELLKISETHCVMIENISSNKTYLQLRCLKNKDLKSKIRRRLEDRLEEG